MRRRAGIVIVVAAVLAAVRAEPAEVTVFAAASLSEAVSEVARGFESESGHKVVLSFGASNALARQIRAGAPADLFFSADAAQVDGLVAANLIRPEDRVDVLSNLLVVVVPASGGGSVVSAADLTRVERLAVADPDAVPAGVYARRWLESIGLWASVRPRIVPLLDVRAALAAVASGNAEAGIVYRTDAATSPRVKVAFEVPSGQGPSIVYPLTRLARARSSAAASAFRYFASKTAREIYRRHGFAVLGGR